MIWIPTADSYVSGPYSIHPTVRAFDVWLTGVKRIGRDITTLQAAKALAQRHAQGEKRVVT